VIIFADVMKIEGMVNQEKGKSLKEIIWVGW